MNKTLIAIIVALVAIVVIFLFSSKVDTPVIEESNSLDTTIATTTDETMDTNATSTDESLIVKEFEIDAFSFGYSLEEIRVTQGDMVRINLTNSDGFHDFVIDEFEIATEKINTGATTSVEFIANEAGEFEYYCSVGDHRVKGMFGTLIVEESNEAIKEDNAGESTEIMIEGLEEVPQAQ